MAIPILSSYLNASQVPYDAKLYAVNLNDLAELGINSNKAFTYYEDLNVDCAENHTTYVWREELSLGETGGILTNGTYVYPANVIANGIDYSGRKFNFFEKKIKESVDIVQVQDLLLFKDRDRTANSLGYKYIKSDFNFTAIPTEYNDSKLIIKDFFNLNGLVITLPQYSTLKMDGGKFDNCTLVGNDTKIESGLDHIFGDNVIIQGTWNVKEVYSQWVGLNETDVNSKTKLDILKSFNKDIAIAEGEYFLESTLNFEGSNFTMYGKGEVLFKSTTLKIMINLKDSTNLEFKNINLTTSLIDATEFYGGLMTSDNSDITNLLIDNCTFSALNCVVNGIKLIHQGLSRLNGITINKCDFINLGRMGIEVQNHDSDLIYRYENVKVTNSTFSLGLVGVRDSNEFPFCISLSGYGINNEIKGNTFKEAYVGCEIIGSSNTTVDGNIFNLPNGLAIGSSNTKPMQNNTFSNNISEVFEGFSSYIRLNSSFSFYNNKLLSQLSLRDVTNCIFRDSDFKTEALGVIFIEGTSTNNAFIDCVFDNSEAPTNNSMFRTSGAGVTKTVIKDSSFIRSNNNGGSYYDNISGAESAVIQNAKFNSKVSLVTTPSRNIVGTKLYAGFNKPLTAAPYTSSVGISLASTTSWSGLIVNVNLQSEQTNGSLTEIISATLFFRHLGATGISKVENIIYEKNVGGITFAHSFVDYFLTITATNNNAASGSHTFTWDLDISGNQLLNVELI